MDKQYEADMAKLADFEKQLTDFAHAKGFKEVVCSFPRRTKAGLIKLARVRRCSIELVIEQIREEVQASIFNPHHQGFPYPVDPPIYH